MNKRTAVKTTVLEPIKRKSKVIKKRKLGLDVREPMDYTKSKLTLSKAKDMGDLAKQVSWSKVWLDARKTSSTFAKLNLVNASVFNAENNWILLVGNNITFAESTVAYKALKAGDNFLVRFFIDVLTDGSLFQVWTSGGTPLNITLNSGPHEIPIIAQADFAGDHAAQLLLKMADRGYYLIGIEIQPLAV